MAKERLEVCFEIKGSGEVDGDVLNKFHGAHFGDEIAEDLPAEPEVIEEAASSDEETTDVADEVDEKPKVTWRKDVLLRVMEAHGISVDDRDAFVEHAVNFDLDDNGYLKKADLRKQPKHGTILMNQPKRILLRNPLMNIPKMQMKAVKIVQCAQRSLQMMQLHVSPVDSLLWVLNQPNW